MISFYTMNIQNDIYHIYMHVYILYKLQTNYPLCHIKIYFRHQHILYTQYLSFHPKKFKYYICADILWYTLQFIIFKAKHF